VTLEANFFRFLGFLLTLGGLLLVTTPDRYASGINQVVQKFCSVTLTDNQIAIVGLVTLAIGLYTILKMR
jgi:uncharacterized protein YjeT (DUF2065 family)